MHQQLTSLIETYRAHLNALNSSVQQGTSSSDSIDIEINETSTIIQLLDNLLETQLNTENIKFAITEINDSASISKKNKESLDLFLSSLIVLDKPNFFYNEMLVQKVQPLIEKKESLTLAQIIERLIPIYTEIQNYYTPYLDKFRFDMNVKRSFDSKIDGLRELLHLHNRGQLKTENCKSLIDGRLEPRVYDLITSKLKPEQYSGCKVISKSGLFISVFEFPKEESDLENEYRDRIKKYYSDDSSLAYISPPAQQTNFKNSPDAKPIILKDEPTFSLPATTKAEEISKQKSEPETFSSDKQYQQILDNLNNFIVELNASKKAYELTFKNYADKLLEIYNNIHTNAKSDSNNKLNPECFQNIEEINTNIKHLVVKSESAYSSGDKVFEIIKGLENQEDHYLQELQEALKVELAKLHELIASIQSAIENNYNELNGKNHSAYSDEVAKSINELSSNVKPLMEATNNINDIFTILKDLSENINKSVIDALSENINAAVISKTIIDANKINNDLAVNALTEIGNSILKANSVESDTAKTNLDNLTTVIKIADKNIQNLVNEINKIEFNLSAVIERFKTDLKKRDDDLKNFMNSELIPCINKTLESNDDLNKSLKINMGFVDKSNKNSSYRNGYIWSAVNFAFTLILLCLMIVLMYNIKSSSSDSAELNRIMNNLNNVDKQNQSAIKKMLDIK